MLDSRRGVEADAFQDLGLGDVGGDEGREAFLLEDVQGVADEAALKEDAHVLEVVGLVPRPWSRVESMMTRSCPSRTWSSLEVELCRLADAFDLGILVVHLPTGAPGRAMLGMLRPATSRSFSV
jgi:hypothetical protein